MAFKKTNHNSQQKDYKYCLAQYCAETIKQKERKNYKYIGLTGNTKKKFGV